jgi:hypothetical protein
VNLNCAIINPHDIFTNITVTWFRSTTEDTSIISTTSEEYRIRKSSGRTDISVPAINCSHELYIDHFSLIILHFTQHKNGYYWCQLSINNTLAQPSHRVQFSVGECNTTNFYYRLANFNLDKNQCAEYVATDSDAGLTTTNESSDISSIASSTRSSVTQQKKESDNPITYNIATELTIKSPSITQQERESDQPIVYVAGSFSALLLIALLGILALSFSFAFYVHHQRKKTSKLHAWQYL